MMVCDRINECPGWEKGYRQLVNCIVFCRTHPLAPRFLGDIRFKRCPWCGRTIKWDDWERIGGKWLDEKDKEVTPP